ncbi:DUF1963 domain-containing protein [Conexibacter woesei]|uniref:DUF1963 domain-containing protein n=1 Tax=Conexibacter woesei TaxID=191495 RepID=UPI0011D25837|nr:DUF1963 domain-containing protein [Conexibacter woesei]
MRLHRPDPWASERHGQDGALEELADDDATASLVVGCDDRGRTVVVEAQGRHEGVREVWFHGDGWSDGVGPDEAVRVLRDPAGRVVASVGLADDAPFAERWTWEDGVTRRADEASLRDALLLQARVAAFDDDGRLATLRWGSVSVAREHADEAAALLAGLDRAGDVVAEEITFDARLHRREPRLRCRDALVGLLAPAIERAVVEAVAGCDVPEPFAVELRRGDEHVVPLVRIGSAAFRDRARSTVAARHAALKLLADAQPPDGQTVSLVDLLDGEALRACRELDWALGDELQRQVGFDVSPEALGLDDDYRGGARGRAGDALDALGDELARRLNERAWKGTADPFLVLVHLGGPGRPVRPFVRAAQAVGKRRVRAFRDSIATRPPPAVEVPAAAYHDRDALQRFLAASGLAADAARLAHDVALVGLRLDAADGAEVRSRLGGPGLLAPGVDWPHAEGGRPHTFLAGIDLAELPATDELPGEGWMLVFADIDDGGEANGLVDESDNAPGAEIHVAYLEPGVAPVAATPPSRLAVVLRERRVRAVAQLTLPTSWQVGVLLGLGPVELAAYYGAVERSVGPQHGCHWILGWETGVQGYLPDDDSILLLHLADDGGLDFNFMDAGSIQFRIPHTALAAGDWSAVFAYADSC